MGSRYRSKSDSENCWFTEMFSWVWVKTNFPGFSISGSVSGFFEIAEFRNVCGSRGLVLHLQRFFDIRVADLGFAVDISGCIWVCG